MPTTGVTVIATIQLNPSETPPLKKGCKFLPAFSVEAAIG
jgi:hypothetical protein